MRECLATRMVLKGGGKRARSDQKKKTLSNASNRFAESCVGGPRSNGRKDAGIVSPYTPLITAAVINSVVHIACCRVPRRRPGRVGWPQTSTPAAIRSTC
uniref:Uncharacterized protein n=1 Tax=Plectus sambesii TaxID=2011161 RepID=A0A914UK94_9BILA